MKILFDNEADRIYCVPVSAVAVRMDKLQPREHWHKRLFTLDVDLMHLKPVKPVEVPDNAAVLRAQLAARDAALDAVLEQLANMRAAESDDARVCGVVLTDLLLKHGVHPK